MRKPFKKSLHQIAIEKAHGGSGRRQLILSKVDGVSKNLEAMTKGFLPAGSVFDWHSHKGIDEFFLVLKGMGMMQLKDETVLDYKVDDLIYIPAGVEHKIEAKGTEENEFYFIRLKTEK